MLCQRLVLTSWICWTRCFSSILRRESQQRKCCSIPFSTIFRRSFPSMCQGRLTGSKRRSAAGTEATTACSYIRILNLLRSGSPLIMIITTTLETRSSQLSWQVSATSNKRAGREYKSCIQKIQRIKSSVQCCIPSTSRIQHLSRPIPDHKGAFIIST